MSLRMLNFFTLQGWKNQWEPRGPAKGALAGVQRCTAPPYFKMDCNAPPNFGDFINNVLQMGVQN